MRGAGYSGPAVEEVAEGVCLGRRGDSDGGDGEATQRVRREGVGAEVDGHDDGGAYATNVAGTIAATTNQTAEPEPA